MRILTLTNMYPTARAPVYGSFVAEQVEALRRHRDVEVCDVHFVDGREHRLNYARAPFQLRTRLSSAGYDVIHAHYGLSGAIAVTQRRVPVVVTFHSGDLELARWQRAVSRMTARLAQESICVSRSSAERLALPSTYATCGIDLDAFRPRDRRQAKRELGVSDDKLTLLFPSSPAVPKKQYERFAAVRHELEQRGHEVHEIVLRGFTRDEVPTVMSAADVMTLTSSQEGSPVAIMEAVASGLPIVATPVGDIESMLDGVDQARVLPFDVNRFADAAEELADRSPSTRSPFPASHRFDQDAIADALVAVLRRAITHAD
jgi:glycosyltransferase involved in cell wall biosynthesis